MPVPAEAWEGVAAPTVELRPSRQAGTQRLAHPLRRPDIADSAEAAERQLPSAPRRTSIRHCDESSSRERRRRVSDHRSSLAADGPSDGLSPSPLRTASRNALGAICAQTLQRVPARPNGRWLRRQDSQICPVERAVAAYGQVVRFADKPHYVK